MMTTKHRTSRWRGRRALIAVTVVALLTGALTVAASPASAAKPSRALVWVGAPMKNCKWPGGSYAANHHRFGADWASDICGGRAGADVVLYAAPKTAAHRIRAYAEVRSSCAGKTVRVHLYKDSKTTANHIGWIDYTHLNPTVKAGEIGRWGTKLGTVWTLPKGAAKPDPNRCWDGAHIHLAATNVTNYACYTKEWSKGGTMNAGNFMGFIGGNYGGTAGTLKRQCP